MARREIRARSRPPSTPSLLAVPDIGGTKARARQSIGSARSVYRPRASTALSVRVGWVGGWRALFISRGVPILAHLGQEFAHQPRQSPTILLQMRRILGGVRSFPDLLNAAPGRGFFAPAIGDSCARRETPIPGYAGNSPSRRAYVPDAPPDFGRRNQTCAKICAHPVEREMAMRGLVTQLPTPKRGPDRGTPHQRRD